MERFVQNLKVRHIAVFLISLSMLCMVVLSLLVHFHPVSTFDLHFTREIQEGRGFALLPAMQFVSFFGAPLVASGTVLLTALAFYLLERRREAFFVLGAFFADGLNALLKLFINRPRPGSDLIEVYETLSNPSFPSGHVVHYVVFFGFLSVLMLASPEFPRVFRAFVIVFSILLVSLVSVSRVYLGVHWVTDTIGGYLVGFMLLSLLVGFYFGKPRHLLRGLSVKKGADEGENMI
jgi:undecaprenyl-diphosphatase